MSQGNYLLDGPHGDTPPVGVTRTVEVEHAIAFTRPHGRLTTLVCLCARATVSPREEVEFERVFAERVAMAHRAQSAACGAVVTWLARHRSGSDQEHDYWLAQIKADAELRTALERAARKEAARQAEREKK